MAVDDFREGGRDQGLGEELGGSINYASDWVVNDFRDLEISRCLFVSLEEN
jgi:hypothetical protein